MTGKKGQKHKPDLIRWFEKVITQDDGCWKWIGSVDEKGYGMFSADGTAHRAHRWGYFQLQGQIPEEYQLHHVCYNRWCVYPLHLEVVTNTENQKRRFDDKTECRNGHPLDDVRLWINPKTGHRHRFCRRCKREWANNHRTNTQRSTGGRR